MTFDEDAFDRMVAAFSTKYGDAKVEKKTLTNRMGAIFQDETYKWRSPTASIEIEKYSGDLKTSMIRIYTDFSTKEYERRKKDEAEKAASDL